MTSIKKVLSESVFNPRVDGPMKIVSDVANRQYYEIRAFELVREAGEALEMKDDNCLTIYHDKMTKAISLLALARATTPQ